MPKVVNIVLKVLLSLIMLMPVVASLGVFPAPTADLYSTPQAFAFIQAMMSVGYITTIMGVVFAAALVLLWTKRTALAMLLILPVTVNIVAFHLVLEGTLFNAGSLMADLLALLNGYFLWQERKTIAPLFASKK